MTQCLYSHPVQLSASDESYLTRFAESPQTRNSHSAALKAFTRFRAWHGRAKRRPTPLADLDMDVLVGFRNWLHRCGYAEMSRDNYVTLITGYLAYAQDRELLAPSFTLERALTRHKQSRKRHSYPLSETNPHLPSVIHYYDNLPLPEGSGEAAIERLDILRARALMHTLYSSAGRVSEVASLTRKDVQDGRRDEAVIVGKGEKMRYLYFLPSAQAAICAYVTARADTDEPLFIYHRRKYGLRMSRQSIWALVHETAEHLEVGEISPHDFRHYRAEQLRNSGAPVADIQAILGHADISTTLRVYAHLDKQRTRESFLNHTRPVKDV